MTPMTPMHRPSVLALSQRRETVLVKWREFRRTKAYDFLAALPVIVWFGLSIGNMIAGLRTVIARMESAALDSVTALAVLPQLAAIAFLTLASVLLAVRRTPAAKAKGLLPRICAFGGTFLMGLIVWTGPREPGLMLRFFSLVLTLGGTFFSIYALAYLGRSFSLNAEARLLVTGGPYAAVRHPLYLGEEIALLGVVLLYSSPLAFLLFAVQFAFQLQRMKNEEDVLKASFPQYAAYRRRTARLLPGIY
jgi:protein-S-isoprenylcysteine O-methyltransferase Ste14